MLNFEEFEKEIKEKIAEYLPHKYRTCKIDTYVYERPGTKYTALTMRAKGMMCPLINLNNLYQYYTETGDLDAVMKNAAKSIVEYTTAADVNWLMDYNAVKTNLFIRICSFERNQDYLRDCPYKVWEGMAITCHIRMKQSEDCSIQSTKVTSDMLKQYDITDMELFVDAFQNAKRILPATILYLDEVVREDIMEQAKNGIISEEEEKILLDNLDPSSEMKNARILTNDVGLNGAATLFYPGMMEMIGEQLGNFFIIPSSIHEVLILPESDGDFDPDACNRMIYTQNKKLSPTDVLSDEAYHYDCETNEIETAKNYVERKSAKGCWIADPIPC